MLEILPYQPRWQDEFVEIATRLRATLGNLALRIDHIGSTSVPDLAAKDVVDIQVTIADAAQLEPVQKRLEAMGLTFRPDAGRDDLRPEWSSDPQDWEKAYFREGAGQKRTHIHVRVLGRANQRYALIFRDYLRTHPKIARHYATMKYQMAAYFGPSNDRFRYTEGKDPMVDLIATLAKEWAEESEWQIGLSDM
jgi:GrpB-like predicted nucleotidyltransferase (UPF0157 family)